MARRKVFYSFDFERDAQRVSQVKQMGVLAGQPFPSANQREDVEAGGKKAIKKWIRRADGRQDMPRGF